MSASVTQIVITGVVFVLGIFFGFIGTLYYFKKKIRSFQEQMGSVDKDQVRNMMSAFGKTPSEEQINRMISSMQVKSKKETNKKPVKKSSLKEE